MIDVYKTDYYVLNKHFCARVEWSPDHDASVDDWLGTVGSDPNEYCIDRSRGIVLGKQVEGKVVLRSKPLRTNGHYIDWSDAYKAAYKILEERNVWFADDETLDLVTTQNKGYIVGYYEGYEILQSDLPKRYSERDERFFFPGREYEDTRDSYTKKRISKKKASAIALKNMIEDRNLMERWIANTWWMEMIYVTIMDKDRIELGQAYTCSISSDNDDIDNKEMLLETINEALSNSREHCNENELAYLADKAELPFITFDEDEWFNEE